jgi:DNA repair protein RadC
MRVWEAKLQYSLISLGDERKLESAQDVVQYLKGAFDEDPTVEWFIAILLDRKGHPLARQVISKGTATGTLVHAREVFKSAIIASSASVIIAHNHPSGDPAPSQADYIVTRNLSKAANILEISLIDHIIIGYPEADPKGQGYYSFSDAGKL